MLWSSFTGVGVILLGVRFLLGWIRNQININIETIKHKHNLSLLISWKHSHSTGVVIPFLFSFLPTVLNKTEVITGC